MVVKHEAHYALLTLYRHMARNRVLPIILVFLDKGSRYVRSVIHRRGRRERETALSQQNASLTPARVISKVIGHRPSRAVYAARIIHYVGITRS